MIRKLIVDDVRFRVKSTSNVGGTTIKRLSVGDAGRIDHHVGASGVDFRRVALISTTIYNANKGLKKRHLGTFV